MASKTLRQALRRCHIAGIAVHICLIAVVVSGFAQWYMTDHVPWFNVVMIGLGIAILVWGTWLRRRILQTIHRGP